MTTCSVWHTAYSHLFGKGFFSPGMHPQQTTTTTTTPATANTATTTNNTGQPPPRGSWSVENTLSTPGHTKAVTTPQQQQQRRRSSRFGRNLLHVWCMGTWSRTHSLSRERVLDPSGLGLTASDLWSRAHGLGHTVSSAYVRLLK